MELTQLQEQIHQLVSRILDLEDEPLGFHEDLSLRGMNSFKTISLVVGLEEVLGLVYTDEELIYENFSTIDCIVSIAAEKLGYCIKKEFPY